MPKRTLDLSSVMGFQKISHDEVQDSEVPRRVVGEPRKKAPALTASYLSAQGITPAVLLKLRNSVDLSKR
jgi:hypothetical protein